MSARAIFDYHGHKIDFSGPSMQALWSGLKYYYSPYDREWNVISESIEIAKCETFVDVGSCIGVFSMMFAQASPEAVVYAFEPASINYKYLFRNMEKFPNIYSINKAVSSVNGKVEIALPTLNEKNITHARDTRDNTGIISVYGSSDIYREEVVKIKLDDTIEHTDFIKIDTEGHEYEVLLGARKLIQRSRPIIMLEMFPHNMKMAGTTRHMLVDFFDEIEYDIIAQWRQDLIMAPLGEPRTRMRETLKREWAKEWA